MIIDIPDAINVSDLSAINEDKFINTGVSPAVGIGAELPTWILSISAAKSSLFASEGTVTPLLDIADKAVATLSLNLVISLCMLITPPS